MTDGLNPEQVILDDLPGGADLNVPPDPFMHGPCRFNTANGYKEDCPNAAVLPGSACAGHLTLIAAANVNAGFDLMGRTKLATPTHARPKRDRAKAKAAAKSRARNRR